MKDLTLNTEQFIAEAKELNKRIRVMRNAMYDEMVAYIRKHGEMRFDAVDDPASEMYLLKGYKVEEINGETMLMKLLESKDKPYVSLHNPCGHWYQVNKGYGFKTIEYIAEYYEIMRNNIK